jgi:hypothetical protein
MGCSSGPDIIQDGLVLCLDAASIRSYPKSGATWSDLAGANDGTLNNMQDNFRDDGAGSLIFDGGDEIVRIQNDMTLSDDFTLSVKAVSNSPTTLSIVAGNCLEQGPIYPQNYVIFHTADGFWRANVKFSGSNWLGVGGPSVISGEWVDISLVRSATDSNIKMFFNGGLYATESSSGSVVLTPQMYFTIGGQATSASSATRHLNGKVAQVSVYNRALSADEIRQNYLSTKERFA